MSVIVFDGICFGDGPTTGVGRAFLEGLRAYASRSRAECVLLVPEGAEVESIEGVRPVAAPRGRLRRQRLLPRLLRELNADLLHSSVAAVPLRAACPTIATVHDLPWLHEHLDERSSWWRRFATKRSLQSAARVLAPSTMTLLDAKRVVGGDGPPVELIPHGVSAPPTPPLRQAQRMGPLIVLGDDRPRKNRARVREAYQRIAAQHPPELRFIGPPDAYVCERDKQELLRTCRAVIHASRFEGFGLVVLEALAHGAPLLCSDLPPLREIAGDVARYVDPDDVASIAGGLVAVHSDDALRARQVDDGPRRASLFTVERVADCWQRVHEEVLT